MLVTTSWERGCSQEERLLQRAEELLVGARLFDGLQVERGEAFVPIPQWEGVSFRQPLPLASLLGSVVTVADPLWQESRKKVTLRQAC